MPPELTSPHGLSLGDPALVAGNVAEPAWRRWHAELAAVGGRSPLVRFVDTPRTRIELSTTHPGGLPQFITGKSTLLSSLIRDELALRNARLAAAEITQKGIELRSVRGIEAVHLAIGLASWRNGGDDYLAPVLLRPLAIRRYGRDFELKLKGQPFLNPALARELRDQFQITLDADAFVALAITNGMFKPQPVIDRLRGLTSHLPWFSVAPRLVVSSFAEVGPAMAADAANLDHPVIDALAGNTAARARLLAGDAERARPVAQDERPPSTDTLLLDADPEQEQVVAEIESGASVVVKTLPGTGGTQTIVNAIGALVARDKRVLVVGARRASLDGIAHRLGQVGLGGAAVTTARPAPRAHPVDLAQREGRASPRRRRRRRPRPPAQGAARLPHRAHAPRPRTARVGARRARRALPARAAAASPPSTTARLDHGRSSCSPPTASRRPRPRPRRRARRVPLRPGRLALVRRRRSPPSDEATSAHELAKRLNDTDVPRLLERGRALIAQTRLRAFESIAELGVFLRLLLDVRETLDRFQPSVYDRSLGELIAATAPRRDSPGMSGANRRRLRRHALEYVRPGVHVTDLHAALRGIQQQRTLWQRYSEAGAIPGVPVGIDDVHVAFQHVANDLAVLDAPLGVNGTPRQLAARPVRELARTPRPASPPSPRCCRTCRSAPRARPAARTRARPAARSTSRAATCARAASPPSSSSRGGSRCSSRSLAGEKALLGANTHGARPARERLPPGRRGARLRRRRRCSRGGSPRTGRSHSSTSPTRRRRSSGCSAATACAVRACSAATPHLFRTLAPVWLASPYEVAAIDRRDPVRHRDPRRRRGHDDRREPRRHPTRPAGRGVRRPGHPDADALRDGHRRRGASAADRRPSTASTRCTPTPPSPGSGSSCRP